MEKLLSRHEFLHDLGRAGLLAGLAGAGAAALHGRRDVSECFNHNYCDSCWAYNGCSLPEKQDLAQVGRGPDAASVRRS
ncbi:MAG: hypothetical protein HYV26_11630 [Candidatus Hydrogenedentes bacterium]|nr:hypothetical protein [Candidatus Hydrogenedentota bacterium]MBI3117979.1 hypothetical protein [Candidatus Hydrogenedentota bacterium]